MNGPESHVVGRRSSNSADPRRRARVRLQRHIKALEAEAGHDDKDVDGPSVRTVLMAHSMGYGPCCCIVAAGAATAAATQTGPVQADERPKPASGFVAADAILSIVDEYTSSGPDPDPDAPGKKELPWIHGLLAFDTPFVGIASPMLAYGAFGRFSRVGSAYRLMTMLPASLLGGGGKDVRSSAPAAQASIDRRTPLGLAAVPAWRTIAAYAGTTGALAAAGIAAYVNRDELYQRCTWIANHLQSVGVVKKREESRLRLARVAALDRFGFDNLYTSLGQNSVLAGGGGGGGGGLLTCRSGPSAPWRRRRTRCPTASARRSTSSPRTRSTRTRACSSRTATRATAACSTTRETRVARWALTGFGRYVTRNLERRTIEAMASGIGEAPPVVPRPPGRRGRAAARRRGRGRGDAGKPMDDEATLPAKAVEARAA